MTRVRCYAGTRYPERPLAFDWEGIWLDVVEVRRSVRTSEGKLVDVLADNRRRYWLEWAEISDNWSAEMML